MTQVRCVLDARVQLGECPVWSPEDQALCWVDILAPALHRHEPATGASRSRPMPSSIRSFGLDRRGGAVVAPRHGFHRLELATGELTLLVHPEPERPLSGGIFALEVDVPGVPVARFKG